MSAASGVKAGEAYVVISAKLDQLRADLRKVPGEVSGGLGKAFSGILGSITPVTAAISAATAAFAAGAYSLREFTSVGSQINDLSARTGLAASELQNMKFAADQTGASLEDIERAAKAFVKDGGNIREFESMGQAIASIRDPSERARVALDMFGKSGTKLLPMFAEFKALKASSASLGPLLTDAEVKAADSLGDAFSALKESAGRAVQQIGAGLAPALQQALEIAVGISAEFANWMKAKKDSGMLGSIGSAALGGGFVSSVFGGFGEKGRESLAGLSKSNRTQSAEDFQDPTKAEKASKDAEASMNAMWRSIESANKSRLALIREFENPAERFIRRQNEINASLAQLNRNRVLGFVSGGEAASQRAGLEEALRRLRTEEQQRLAEMFKPAEQATAEKAMALTSSKGTFSSAAAGLLGRAGDSADLRESKTQTAVLKRIETNTAKLSKPRFS